MDLSMYYRPDTQDELAMAEVITQNCYHLPENFQGDEVILDLGAHIGSFAMACLYRGAGKVVAVEPDPDSFAILKKNTNRYGKKVLAINAAVWKNADEQLRLEQSKHPQETCCSQTITGRGRAVDTVALDGLIDLAIGKQGGILHLLKIDIEGAEYPVLMTSKKLRQVQRIVGETHLMKSEWSVDDAEGKMWPATHAGMACFLWAHGFHAYFTPNAKTGLCNLFDAANTHTVPTKPSPPAPVASTGKTPPVG